MELKNRSFQYGKYRLVYLLHRVLRASPAYTRSTFSKSVMVLVAVSLLRTTELMFGSSVELLRHPAVLTEGDAFHMHAG